MVSDVTFADCELISKLKSTRATTPSMRLARTDRLVTTLSCGMIPNRDSGFDLRITFSPYNGITAISTAHRILDFPRYISRSADIPEFKPQTNRGRTELPELAQEHSGREK